MKLAVRGEAFASLQLGARLLTARTRNLVICSAADTAAAFARLILPRKL
jgi:hypothetical protein